MVMSPDATAQAIWINIQGLFRDNAEAHAIYLEQEFRSLVQGGSSIVDYCHKQKTLVDALCDVDCKISDKTLVLNTLHGLNEKYAFMRTLVPMQKPFPLFLETRSALILEELQKSSAASPPSAFFTNTSAGGSGNKGSNNSTNHGQGGGNSYNNRHCNNRGNNGGSGSGGGGGNKNTAP